MEWREKEKRRGATRLNKEMTETTTKAKERNGNKSIDIGIEGKRIE